MSDPHGVNGQKDPVAQFCEEISVPLEITANALFIASQTGADSILVTQMLKLATARLDEVRDVVFARIDPHFGLTET